MSAFARICEKDDDDGALKSNIVAAINTDHQPIREKKHKNNKFEKKKKIERSKYNCDYCSSHPEENHKSIGHTKDRCSWYLKALL